MLRRDSDAAVSSCVISVTFEFMCASTGMRVSVPRALFY